MGFLCLQPGGQPFVFPFGHHVDPAVHYQDDDQGEVEGAQRWEQDVARLLGDLADGLILRGWLLPAEQGPNRDDQGQCPDTQQGQEAPPLCHYAGVPQWVAHPDVSINGDDAEAHDGSSTAKHVNSCPDVAEDPPKDPVAQNLHGGWEGQDGRCQEEVSYSQVDDVIVGDTLEVSVAGYGQDNQDITQNPKNNQPP